MRESELRDWIEELAEEQAEKEQQRSERRKREQQTLEEIRQRQFDRLREKYEEEGIDPDPFVSLFEFDDEIAPEEQEDLEARREELIEQGKEVDLPNETSAFLDGAGFQSNGFTSHRPYYVEIRGPDGGLEYSERNPESIDVRVVARGHREEVTRTVNWWFSFTPDSTKLWDFFIVVPYRGFHAMRASPPTGEALLHLAEEYRAHQYNAGPRERQLRLLEIRDNTNRQTRFDQILSGRYAHVLAGGDPALLHLHQRLDVSTRGSGSWSELNFGTGDGNRLPAPYFYVS